MNPFTSFIVQSAAATETGPEIPDLEDRDDDDHGQCHGEEAQEVDVLPLGEFLITATNYNGIAL